MAVLKMSYVQSCNLIFTTWCGEVTYISIHRFRFPPYLRLQSLTCALSMMRSDDCVPKLHQHTVNRSLPSQPTPLRVICNGQWVSRKPAVTYSCRESATARVISDPPPDPAKSWRKAALTAERVQHTPPLECV